MTTRSTSRGRRMVVRVPERDLADSLLDLARPLLERLGPTPAIDDARAAIELTIELWNAHVTASKIWGVPRPKPLADLRKAMEDEQHARGDAETFGVLSEHWRKEFAFDPRLVGKWSYEPGEGSGRRQLVCETKYPDGVEPEVSPPIEKRIALDGRFLDEVRIRQTATTNLVFPIENHRGAVDAAGIATVHAKMPTVMQLFAEGRLSPIGGPPVDVMIAGRELGPMLLTEVRCAGDLGINDVAVLVFRPANAGAA